MPSTMLKAFVAPITAAIVTKGPRIPSSIGPKPSKSPKVTSEVPEPKVSTAPKRTCTPRRNFAGRSRASSTAPTITSSRSEEHTSELQSRPHLVCRLLLEKKNKTSFIFNYWDYASDDRFD